MRMINSPNSDAELPDSPGLNRRTVLMTAAVAASAAAGVSPALADTVPSGNFGAPLVELQVPVGALTLEQKAAMIKGMTDVVLNVLKLPPDPSRKAFTLIVETAEGGWGVDGQVLVRRPKYAGQCGLAKAPSPLPHPRLDRLPFKA
jgi:phenylpyruvate tautomerase PptA (4-oxalocrotonate tautomerase family)